MILWYFILCQKLHLYYTPKMPLLKSFRNFLVYLSNTPPLYGREKKDLKSKDPEKKVLC